MLLTNLPMSAYRIHNWLVDLHIKWASRGIAKPHWAPHQNERGQPKIAEYYGPEYPQCIRDLARLYRDNRFRITRKLLCKVGRCRREFRGLISFQHRDCVPIYTLEFHLPGGSIFIVFQDLEYVADDAVRAIVRGRVSMHEFFIVLAAITDRLEYALLPKAVRIRDGGRSLRAA